MSHVKKVEDALASGADPAMLCQTCPWDRYCIEPPDMSKADYEAQMEKAKADDEAEVERKKAAGQQASLPMGSLLTALTLGGRTTMGKMCPVFAARLRSSSGRGIADGLKQQMAAWDDEAMS